MYSSRSFKCSKESNWAISIKTIRAEGRWCINVRQNNEKNNLFINDNDDCPHISKSTGCNGGHR